MSRATVHALATLAVQLYIKDYRPDRIAADAAVNTAFEVQKLGRRSRKWFASRKLSADPVKCDAVVKYLEQEHKRICSKAENLLSHYKLTGFPCAEGFSIRELPGNTASSRGFTI